MSTIWKCAVAFAAAAFSVGAAQAATFNATLASPGFYNGSGNSSDHFTVETASAGNVEIGLGVQYRFAPPPGIADAQVTPEVGSNIYHVLTGTSSCFGTCSLWNIEYSINTNAQSNGFYSPLGNFTVGLDVLNKGNGEHQSIPVSGLDNAYYGPSGKHATLNASSDYGEQNSQNFGFFPYYGLAGGTYNPAFNFNPLAAGDYLVTLTLLADDTTIASVQAEVIAAAAPTPVPAALPLFASGLGALGFVGWRRKRKAAALAT